MFIEAITLHATTPAFYKIKIITNQFPNRKVIKAVVYVVLTLSTKSPNSNGLYLHTGNQFSDPKIFLVICLISDAVFVFLRFMRAITFCEWSLADNSEKQ